MANTQWDPLREMEDLLQRYARAVPAQAGGHGRSEHLATADWRPLVDIAETAELYLIEAEIAGVRREDVRVGVEDGVLTIQGQRDTPHADATSRKQHRAERPTGRFARSFALPETADIERITARVEDGVITISIPKLAERGKRGIEIKVG